MSKKVELIGERFGRLIVISEGEKYKGSSTWICICDCGNITRSIPITNLRSGNTTSCGCLQKEIAKASLTIHGKRKTRLYKIWCSMKQRCYDKKNTSFHKYGARGITVCEEWRNNFQAFYNWAMASGYKPDAKRGECTIDLIDKSGNYCPENCKWSTTTEQSNNKSNNVFFEAQGQKHTVAEWAKITGIKYATLYSRVLRGHTGEEILKEVRSYDRI